MGEELERLIEQYGGKVPKGSDEDIALEEIARMLKAGEVPVLLQPIHPKKIKRMIRRDMQKNRER